MNQVWPAQRRSFITGSLSALATSKGASAQAEGYVCADCGCAFDGKLFAAPGPCRAETLPMASSYAHKFRGM